MFLDQVLNGGALPTLERTAQFAARRHELIAHNIANISTPNFQTLDVSPGDFQRSLGEAIDRRRSRFGGERGSLEFKGNREVGVTAGGLRLQPRHASGNVLFHDRNDRDVERLMQGMVENLAVFRFATDMMKSRMDQINAAIAERAS